MRGLSVCPSAVYVHVDVYVHVPVPVPVPVYVYVFVYVDVNVYVNVNVNVSISPGGDSRRGWSAVAASIGPGNALPGLPHQRVCPYVIEGLQKVGPDPQDRLR